MNENDGNSKKEAVKKSKNYIKLSVKIIFYYKNQSFLSEIK